MTVLSVDLDGVLCKETKPYSKAEPLTENIELLKNLKNSKNVKIIIHTARRERDRNITLKWLKNNGVPFDKLVMGKPRADFYIDDRAISLEDLCKTLK